MPKLLKSFLAVAEVMLQLFAVALSDAGSETVYTGYVVDNYCWNRPQHRGIDGSQLGTAPGTHILHCLWQVPPCREQGYVMLERLSSPAADGSTYWPKYQLDAVGDDLIFQMGRAEQVRGGDRQFNEMVTVTGTVSGFEMAVSSVCITPRAKNENEDTFCFRAVSPPTVTATTTMTAVSSSQSRHGSTSATTSAPTASTTTEASGSSGQSRSGPDAAVTSTMTASIRVPPGSDEPHLRGSTSATATTTAASTTTVTLSLGTANHQRSIVGTARTTDVPQVASFGVRNRCRSWFLAVLGMVLLAQ